MKTILELEQELRDASCFLNCGGMYCNKDERATCSTWKEAEGLELKIEGMRKGADFKRNNPQRELVTGRDYEKAILIKQEEDGVYDV